MCQCRYDTGNKSLSTTLWNDESDGTRIPTFESCICFQESLERKKLTPPPEHGKRKTQVILLRAKLPRTTPRPSRFALMATKDVCILPAEWVALCQPLLVLLLLEGNVWFKNTRDRSWTRRATDDACNEDDDDDDNHQDKVPQVRPPFVAAPAQPAAAG